MRNRVLFICTGNRARSQIAEGLLRSKASDRMDVFSAGTEPKGLHPWSVDVMREIGIDISGQESKSVSLFENQNFDYVITVCDQAKEACPVFHRARKMLHWSILDPQTPEDFRTIRDELNRRIDAFLGQLASEGNLE